jgi:hypothetical protein
VSKAKYSHDNWNQIWNMPLSESRDRRLRLVGSLARGNLRWFVRRLIGGISSDNPEDIESWISSGKMLRATHMKRDRSADDT